MLQFVTWTVTGLGVGWLARTLMRSRRDFGLVGDLITGWLGALVGGWVFRSLNVVAPNHPAAHVMIALVGAAALLTALRFLRQVMTAAQGVSVSGAMSSAVSVSMELEERVKRLGALERHVLWGLLSRQHWSADPNQAFDAQTTFGERVADRVAAFGGSWTFIGLFGVGMVSWMAINQGLERPFDPFPYILLNLILSCLAALQAPVIMMSQNRQNARDRSDARSDYEVNIRAEMEIASVHAKLDLLREQEWQRLVKILEEQQRVLDAIRGQLAGNSSPGEGTARH